NLFRNPRFHTVNQLQLAALDRLLAHAAAAGHAADRVLDLPCGTGRLLPGLATRATRIVGCDIALPMLLEAGKKAPRTATGGTHLMAGNAEQLPFADGTFDAVVSCRFLRHVPRSMRVSLMREMGRVTCAWVIVDPRWACHPRYLREFARGLLSLPWRLPNYGLTRRTLAAELAAAGLHLERVECLSPDSCTFLALARKTGSRA